MAREKVMETPVDKARWLSDFLAYNIDDLSKPDFVRLDMHFYYFLDKEGFLGDFTFTGWDERREQLKRAQQAAKEILSKFMAHMDVGETIKRKYSIDFQVMISGGHVIREYVDDLLTGLENVSTVLVHEIAGILQWLPPSSIKQCANIAYDRKGKRIPAQSCDNFFIQTDKRKKLFCSVRCASRFSARKARLKDPEGYKKKQRKIMRTRYKNKQKKVLGPNVQVET